MKKGSDPLQCRKRVRPLCHQAARRRGAALMLAMFVMSVTSVIVIAILDTETLQYSSLRHTMDYDRGRYLAEAGVQHALAQLETDITWRAGISETEFPAGSGSFYSATAEDGPNGTVIVTGTGTSGEYTRHLQITVKQGG